MRKPKAYELKSRKHPHRLRLSVEIESDGDEHEICIDTWGYGEAGLTAANARTLAKRLTAMADWIEERS